jgi:UDP-3-O-[3-hydroxymyristoyl] glucosamine N-acyltransferase
LLGTHVAGLSPPRVADVVAALGGELLGDGDLELRRIGALEAADEHTVAHLSQARYRNAMLASAAGCVIAAPAEREALQARRSAILTADPYLYYARLTQWWAARQRPARRPGIHASAVVEPGAQVHPSATIGPLSYVASHAVVGESAWVGAQCHLAEGAQVGPGTRLHARVTMAESCQIGARGIVHSGSVIGADGFGFAPTQGRWEKIEQLGVVRIGDDVEIGANTCIDRGALEDTVLGDGVKLDNLVQVGHNVQVGAHCAMAGCVGIAGSARIGVGCTFGGGAIVLGHLQLVDGVHVSAMTIVTRSILKPGLYSGVFPFDENAAWEKNAATLRQLHALRERLRALEKLGATGA